MQSKVNSMQFHKGDFFMKVQQILSVQQILPKLLATSFDTPQKNKNILDFYKSCVEWLEFLDMERKKLFESLGVDGSITKENEEYFATSIQQILEMDANDVPQLIITENDILNCEYSKNKSLWLSAYDIDTVTSLLLKVDE